MGAVVCFVVIPAVRIYFLAILICDDLADVRLLFFYQSMQVFFVRKYISLSLILTKTKHKGIKNAFQELLLKDSSINLTAPELPGAQEISS